MTEKADTLFSQVARLPLDQYLVLRREVADDGVNVVITAVLKSELFADCALVGISADTAEDAERLTLGMLRRR